MNPPDTNGERPLGGRLTALSDGRLYQIPDAGVVIGRDHACDVVLTSPRVSRRHARILLGPLGYSLLDDSTNGVVVNGARVENTALLKQGDIIGIGAEAFRFNVDDPNGGPDPTMFASRERPQHKAVPAPAPPTVPTETTPRSKRPS